MIERFFSIFYIIHNKYYDLEEYGVEKTLRLAYYLIKEGLWDGDFIFFTHGDYIECNYLIDIIKISNPKNINIRTDYFYDYDLIKILKLRLDIKKKESKNEKFKKLKGIN